ncbi:hypothetical protein B5S29_g2562 [[Candida] boidinii]|nr:hypothetical protein B5S29_g2562 [[Candida] boidinii]
MTTLDFDDYDSILSSLHQAQNGQDNQAFQSLFVKQEQNNFVPAESDPLALSSNKDNIQKLLQQQLKQQQKGSRRQSKQRPQYNQSDMQQQQQQQQQQQDIQLNDTQMSRYDLDATNTNNLIDFDELNDAMSSYHSATLSPYSSSSSPEELLFGYPNQPLNTEMVLDSFKINDLPITETISNTDSTNSFNPEPLIAENIASNNKVANNNIHSLTSTSSVSSSNVTATTAVTSATESVTPPSKQKKANPRTRVKKEDLNSILPSGVPSASGIGKPGKRVKSSHNLIEKKYRTNINSKIIELRNCVPSLRILISKNHNHRTNTVPEEEEIFDDDYEGNGFTDDEERLDGLKPAKKLNKATILSKATEYIKHLEWKSAVLFDENLRLKDMLLNSNVNSDAIAFSHQQSQANQQAQQNYFYTDSSISSSPTLNNSNSPVNNNGAPVMNEATAYNQGNQDNSLTNKILLGGMTCLLGTSSFDDISNNGGSGRKGLFAIPAVFSNFSNSSPFGFESFRPLLGLTKLILSFGVFYFYIVVPLLNSIVQSHDSSNSSKKIPSKKITANMIFSRLAYICWNPVSFYNKLMCLSYQEIENQLLLTLENSTNVQYVRRTDRFYSTFFKLLTTDKSSYNSFMKSMYFKRSSEINLVNSNEQENLIYSQFKKHIVSPILNKFGSRYWNLAVENINEETDNNDLVTLLTKVKYEDISLSTLLKVEKKEEDESKDESSQYNHMLTNFARHHSTIAAKHNAEENESALALKICLSISDELVNSCLKRMITLETITKKTACKSASIISEMPLFSSSSSTNEDGNSEELINQYVIELRDLITKDLNCAISLCSSSKEQLLRCSALQCLLYPTEKHLKFCFKVLKTLDDESIEEDTRVSLISCVLRYQLINHPEDHKLILTWLNKLKIPNFTHNFGIGSDLNLYEFVSLCYVFNLLSLELLEKVNEEIIKHPSLNQEPNGTLREEEAIEESVNSTIDDDSEDADDESELDEDDSTFDSETNHSSCASSVKSLDASSAIKPSISKLNFKLLNILANMRIFIGKSKDNNNLDLFVKDSLIDGFVIFIEKLNGF